ncbi:MAG: M48 family metallopeptidase [Candidatus Eremiobacteraeota bacterium]|nr:M48 family metallopeptidase [Candidatus Eremiobacteraeota bacterium]
MKKLFLGIGAGISAGYLAFRAWEAWREWRDPSAPVGKDAEAYSRARRGLQVAATLRGMAGAVAFAYGPLGKLAGRTTRWAPPWLRPALLIGPLSIAAAAADIATDFVEDYTLERRYELSDQSRQAWLADYAKSTLLSTALGVFVVSLFGVAVRHAPRWWPIFASIGVFPLFVLGNIIVPLYVMPMFNAFEPLTGSLEERLRKLAGRYDVGDAEILRMDMSRQTRKANAFVTGIGRTHRIVLGDTLIEKFPENEIEFVVAHELGHYVSKDTWRLIAVSEALSIVLFLAAQLLTPAGVRAEEGKNPLLLVRFYAVMLVATQVLRPLFFAFSRSREWSADRFAIEATRDPKGGVSAFRRLRDQNLADEDPPGWYEFFFSSHPSLKNRIAALEGQL